MVNKFLFFLIYSIVFILATIYFSPKESLYFTLEKTFKSNGIIISDETIKDNGFSLNMNNAKLYLKTIESADIKSMKLSSFVLYNSLNISDIKLSSLYKSYMPLHINNINLTYTIFNPLNINIQANGEFGESESSFNLSDLVLHVKLIPSQLMLRKYKQSLKDYTKNENGEFTYDKTF